MRIKFINHKKVIMSADDVVAGLKNVQQRMVDACKKRSKDLQVSEPRLVAVSKTKPIEHVIAAYKYGQRYFGENYVNELVDKATNRQILAECPDIKWHYIGHLQRNKISKIINIPSLYIIETVDSEKLSSALETACSNQNRIDKLNIFVQVNTSQETEKNGVLPNDVDGLVRHIITHCPHLNFKGLMTIGKYGYDLSMGPNPDFLCLVKCRETVCTALNLSVSDVELSMGMSDDFEHAIEVGSTNVRVGTAIFGYKPKKGKLSYLNESDTNSLPQNLGDMNISNDNK